MSEAMIEKLQGKIFAGDAKTIGETVQEALDAGLNAETILNEGMITAMREVGRRFESGEAFVPEMLIAARAMTAALVVLRPHLVASDVKPVARIAIGTVQGDLHDIGKTLVSMMCEGEGFEIVDLGVNVPPQKFIEAIKDGAQIIGMSALLTTTMGAMKTTIAAIEEAGLRDQVKIMVGGAPITQSFADEIGADGYAADASAAARTARDLIEVA